MKIRKSWIGMGWFAGWLLVVATVSGCSWFSRVANPESCSMTPAVTDAVIGGGLMFVAFLAHGPQPSNGINEGSLFIGAPATLLSPLVLAAAACTPLRTSTRADRRDHATWGRRPRSRRAVLNIACCARSRSDHALATWPQLRSER